MKIKRSDFEINFRLPNDLEQEIAVTNHINSWTKLILEERKKEKRALRLKKINEINAKFK